MYSASEAGIPNVTDTEPAAALRSKDTQPFGSAWQLSQETQVLQGGRKALISGPYRGTENSCHR